MLAHRDNIDYAQYVLVMRLMTRALLALASLPLLAAGVGTGPVSAQQSLTLPSGITIESEGPTPRVVGGVPANRANTPWYVLLNPVIGGESYICGGTAISLTWILTAAHCVTDSQGGAMTLLDRQGSSMFVNPASLSATGAAYGWGDVVVHPDWNRAMLANDIALVRSSSALPVVPLAFSADTSGPTPGTALQVFGFGARSFGGPLSSTLQLGNVLDLVGTAGACGGYGQWYHDVTQLCAGLASGGVDSCQGDSGGPLTATTTNGPNVVGVVSFGNKCGDPGYPGVYTRVSRYAPWVTGQTGIPASASRPAYQSPGRAVITRSCKSKVCKLKKGGASLKVTVRNAGGQSVSWKVSAGKLKKSRSGGNLASGASSQSILRVTNAKKACIKVTVTGTGAPAVTFKVATNGKKC